MLVPNPPYPNCINVEGNGDFDNTGMFGMSSFHSDGANIVMCGGSESVPKGWIERRKGMNPKPYSSALTDKQWAILEPLMPPARPGGRPRKTEMRQGVNARFYRHRNGCN
jgi:prepilin-type processing-associated H-X9-DG protein